MGHALMDKVLAQWIDLPGNAFKVLMLMAKTAMDDDLAPVYYGGWERLAVTGLGRRDWPSDDDESEQATQTRRASFEAVRQAVQDLTTAGAIKVSKRGKSAKQQARYALSLDAANLWTTRQRRRETLRNDAGKPCAERRETLQTTQGKAGAKETRRNQEETRGETRSGSGDNSPTREAGQLTSNRLRLVRARADADLAQESQGASMQELPTTHREEPTALVPPCPSICSYSQPNRSTPAASGA